MFTPHKRDTAGALPWEYLPAAAGTYQAGQLLKLADGALAPASAASTTTLPYLCMADITVEEGGNVPVCRVRNDTIFQTTLSAAAADAKVGTRLQIAAGGLAVNASAAGSFEVTALEGTAAGDTVWGRFQ